jgi:hypothetical protein
VTRVALFSDARPVDEDPAVGRAAPVEGSGVRFGRNVEVRPLGGGIGCLGMILFSILASIILTVLVNLLLR